VVFDNAVNAWTLEQIDQTLTGRARWPRHHRDAKWWERTNRILDRRLELMRGRQ
jgi:hypothetical protein